MNNCNIAFVGIDFPHLITGIHQAFESANLPIKAALWVSRLGSKKYIRKDYGEIPFLNDDRLMHADWPYLKLSIKQFRKIESLKDNPLEDYPGLSEIELDHCSYTRCRNMLFRPTSSMRKYKSEFEEGLELCLKLLKSLDIHAIVFTTPPHNIFDVLLHLAARRLKILQYSFAALEFQDIIYPRYFTRSIAESDTLISNLSEQQPTQLVPDKVGVNFHDSLQEYLESRNRLSNSFNVWYMDPDATPANPIAAPQSPILLSDTFYKIFRLFGYTRLKSMEWFYKLIRYSEIVSMILLNNIQKVYRMWQKKLYHQNLFFSSNETRDILLYALHYHPEVTTSTSSFCSPFEILAIEKLAVSFPNKTIIIKEHPAMLRSEKASNFWRYRGLEFFKHIKQFNNVRYIPIMKGKEFTRLLQKAECVFTFTGTVSVEAILLGTPCILFGHNAFAEQKGIEMLDDPLTVDQHLLNKLNSELQGYTQSEILERYTQYFSNKNIKQCYIGGMPVVHWTDVSLENSAKDAFLPVLNDAFHSVNRNSL